jgi:hypothetical protein
MKTSKVLAAAVVPIVWSSMTQAQTVAPRVKPYKVSNSLREVSNYNTVRKALPITPAQRALLAKNLFACSPTKAQQLFHIYEENDYKNVPSFVTVDSVLQLYHIFYDFALRNTESQKLLPVLKRLTAGMLNSSIADWNGARDASIKEAAWKNVVFFGVADRLLGQSTGVPEEARAPIAAELAKINAHGGFEVGAVFPYKIDYSQFVPRGHYTRSEDLKKYFRSMMWYGLAPFAMRTDGKRNDQQIRQGLLWVRGLYRNNWVDEWATIYEPTSFFVGASDDLTPREWKALSDRIFGSQTNLGDFALDAKFNAFANAAEKLRPARIQARFGRQNGVPAGTPNMIEPPLPSGVQLRFMGQRYIPDSEILQRLSTPIERVFPSGLDVMAVLGSARARNILDQHASIYNARNWSGYTGEREKLRQQFAKLPQATWSSNLYYGWLYALKALNEPTPTGYPSFMRNAAWSDKSLNTALGSWAELRHNTVLYGKQSVVECGGGEDTRPFVKGYVEPNVLFYSRLLQLTTMSRQGLTKRNLLSPELKEKFADFEDLLTMLRRISQKQLANQPLTRAEYEEIRYIGGKIEYMTLRVMAGSPTNWELVSNTDKHMAVIADVHTGGDKVLEVGVGHPYEIWAIVPIEGKLSLVRGATFSFYEFKHPASDRLTDEKWQALLKSGKAPVTPIWTRSFVTPDKARPINANEMEAYSSGC